MLKNWILIHMYYSYIVQDYEELEPSEFSSTGPLYLYY